MAKVSAVAINGINRRDVLRLGLAAGVLGATDGVAAPASGTTVQECET